MSNEQRNKRREREWVERGEWRAHLYMEKVNIQRLDGRRQCKFVYSITSIINISRMLPSRVRALWYWFPYSNSGAWHNDNDTNHIYYLLEAKTTTQTPSTRKKSNRIFAFMALKKMVTIDGIKQWLFLFAESGEALEQSLTTRKMKSLWHCETRDEFLKLLYNEMSQPHGIQAWPLPWPERRKWHLLGLVRQCS